MFSVAVKVYGIVIWDGDGEWRTFGATESLSATLTARVENALETVPVFSTEGRMGGNRMVAPAGSGGHASFVASGLAERRRTVRIHMTCALRTRISLLSVQIHTGRESGRLKRHSDGAMVAWRDSGRFANAGRVR